MNRLKEKNSKQKMLIQDLEQEVKFLTKQCRNQGKDLMEKKEKDNQPYISLLERENSMIKKDKNKIALNYNKAIKDQLNLHETNIRLKEQIREIERSPSQNKNAINQVFNDPETQDQVAKELVGVARLQKQVLILEKSNNSLRNTKSIK